MAIGVMAFIAYKVLVHLIVKISDDPVLYALLAVVLGSILPDILEPPTSWMHRGVYHSKRALKSIEKIFVVTVFIGILVPAFVGIFVYVVYIFSIFYVISNFFLGYTLHLLADSTTKVGLPD